MLNLLPIVIGLRYTGAKRKKSQLISFLSGISIAGLVVGVGLLITVLSVMNGFDRELRENILGLVPQAVINHQEGIAEWQPLVDELTADKDILAVAPYVQTYGLVALGKQAEPVVLYGVEPVYEVRVSRITDFIAADVLASIEQGEPSILLGKDLAAKLNVSVGNKVMMVVPGADGGRAAPKTGYFKVVGLVDSKTELDATLAITSLTHSLPLTSHPNAVTGVRLKLNNLFDAPYVVYRHLLELGPGYSGNNWTRTHGNLYHAIKMSKSLVGLLMSLVVAIAAFNVVSTLVLVVVDKQGDIAILRTLGISTKQIMAIFITQGTAIGLIGTSLGLAVGCVLSLLVQNLVRIIEAVFGVQFLKSDVYPLTYLPSEILLQDILAVGITAFVMCFLATLYPAWKASRVQPADALRYE